MSLDVAIHVNQSQPHQREHASWFAQGFMRHGIRPTITNDIDHEADIHIVSGPHYAKKRWQGHPQTVLLDIAQYHEEKTGRWKSMDWVSLGWMNDDGGRTFNITSGREPPKISNCRGESGSIFLADYEGPIEDADTIRLHPARIRSKISLVDILSRHKLAIGYTTTALVRAGLQGLEIECKDERSIMHQPNWLELLPYADWHYSEIESGEAWEHLHTQLQQSQHKNQ